MNRIPTMSHDDTSRRPRHRRQLLTVNARVRSLEVTPLGHVSCVLDSAAGRLCVLSDAAAVHLPELTPGTQVHAVLLRVHRASAEAQWHWQLLCCRAVHEEVLTFDVDAMSPATQGSAQ